MDETDFRVEGFDCDLASTDVLIGQFCPCRKQNLGGKKTTLEGKNNVSVRCWCESSHPRSSTTCFQLNIHQAPSSLVFLLAPTHCNKKRGRNAGNVAERSRRIHRALLKGRSAPSLLLNSRQAGGETRSPHF